MTSPLERAARALANVVLTDPAWYDERPSNAGMVQAGARAVLKAIREPSEGMIEAAYPDLNLSREDSDSPAVEITRAWSAMIDAALSEKPE